MGADRKTSNKPNKLYRRPVNQYESDSSLTNKVHEKFYASYFSLFKEIWNLSLIKFRHMKKMTLSQKAYLLMRQFYFNWTTFHVLLANLYSLTQNKNDRFAFFFETSCFPSFVFLKSVSIHFCRCSTKLYRLSKQPKQENHNAPLFSTKLKLVHLNVDNLVGATTRD